MTTATQTVTEPAIAVPPSAVDAYRRSGFLRGPQVLDSDEVETLKAEVLRVIEQREVADQPQPVMCHRMGGEDCARPVWQIVNIWQASPAFERLVRSPVLAAWAAALTGARELKVWHDQIQYKPPETGGETSWHQDSPLWPTLEPRDSMITAWIALDDAGPDNGCMSMVPGSQRWGDHQRFLATEVPGFTELPETFEGHDVHPVVCAVPAGCVHFHHPLTWHGSPINESGRPRRALGLHFATDRACFQPEAEHCMKRFIESGPGEPLRGAPFISVWSR